MYSKATPHGERKFNEEDKKIVRKVQELFSKLPVLKLPLDTDYMITETDGCAEGWGGILKCRPYKDAPESTKRICRFASGLIRRKASTINCDILAIIYSLDKFRLFLLDKEEFTVRTDCVSIVKFSSKLKHNSKKKIGNARWTDFLEILATEN